MIPIEFQNNRVAFLCFDADVLFEQHIRNALFIFYLMNLNSATQGVFVFSFFFLIQKMFLCSCIQIRCYPGDLQTSANGSLV